MTLALASKAKADCERQPIYCQIKDNNPNISDTKAHLIAKYVIKSSKKYGIPANIYTAILMQESSYRLNALNKKCGLQDKNPLNYGQKTCVVQDVGISQINVKTAEAYKLDAARLTTDLEYSIDSGAMVLSWFHKRYSKTEKNWWIRYNVGTRAKETMPTAWEAYKSKVKRWL